MDRIACSRLKIPSICLMENAGAGAAQIARVRLGSGAQTVVCACGPGQNGGDGFVVARHLAVAGHHPRIVLLEDPGSRPPEGDAGTNFRACLAMGIPVHVIGAHLPDDDCAAWLSESSLVVDALFGTGLARPLAGTAAHLVTILNRAASPVLALDVPSGLDCDTGVPLGACIRADVTVTFVAPKLGFLDPASRAWTGEVVVVPIGAPAEWPCDR